MGKVGKAVAFGAGVALVAATAGAAIPALASGESLFGAGGALTTAAGSILASTAISGTLAGVNALFAPHAPHPSSIASVRTGVGYRELVYGRVRKGGTVAHLQNTDGAAQLDYIIALGGHMFDAIEEIYFADTKVWDYRTGKDGGKFYGYFGIQTRLGTDDQTAVAGLVGRSGGQWTSAHRLRGIPYLSVMLRTHDKAWRAGEPSITAVVRGKRVFDPRTGATEWSQNPALCIRDYILDADLGLGASLDEIDEASFIAAANVCDEALSSGELRYRINGVIASSTAPGAALESMLVACNGLAPYVGGKFHLVAGAWAPSSMTLTEDDLAGAVNVQVARSRSDTFNTVRGAYVSAVDRYIDKDYHEVSGASFLAEDGETILRELNFPFADRKSEARRLALLYLKQSRARIVVDAPFKLRAMRLVPGDFVQVTLARYGWAEKEFRVERSSLSVSGEGGLAVALSLRETSADLFSAGTPESADVAGPATSLDGVFDPAPPGLAVTDELAIANETVYAALRATPTSSVEPTVRRFEVQARKSGDSEWLSLATASDGGFLLPNVEAAAYDVRARVSNVFGVSSDWATTTHLVAGLSAPPSDVTGFSIVQRGDAASATWNASPDLDLSYYRIRHSPTLSGATWDGSLGLVAKVARPATSVSLPAIEGTYLIKAVDKSGVASRNAALFVVSNANIGDFHLVRILAEEPGFSGGKFHTEAFSGTLRLSLDGSGEAYPSGTYDFADTVDLGAKYTARLRARAAVQRDELGISWSTIGGRWSDYASRTWSGDGGGEDIGAAIMVSTTDDDPSGAPTWRAWEPFITGDYSARGFRFRAELTSQSASVRPVASELSVTVSTPASVRFRANVASGAGPLAVAFNGFRVLGSVQILPHDMATGDYFTITGKSNSGFTITFRNAAGAPISRWFDWTAYGYGDLIT